MLAKLRDKAQFESTWAEIRCVSLLARTADSDVELELESGKATGAHADMRLVLPEGPPHTSIEIKTVGLSDAEVDFCRRMRPSLGILIPPVGMVNVNAPLDGKPPKLTTSIIGSMHTEAAQRLPMVPQYPPGLAAATIVARETELKYVRRVAARVVEALRQLPDSDECWIGLYWTNGAPVDAVIRGLDWSQIPDHVLGIVFVGCVLAFPHRNIDCFTAAAPRGSEGADMDMSSEYNEELARLVFQRTEASAGVRAALMRGVIRGKHRQILLRDGGERIPPFNLIIDRDASGRQFAGRDEAKSRGD